MSCTATTVSTQVEPAIPDEQSTSGSVKVFDIRDGKLKRLGSLVGNLKLHNAGLKAQLLSLAKGRSEFLNPGEIAVPIPLLKALFLTRFCRKSGFYNQGRTMEDLQAELFAQVDALLDSIGTPRKHEADSEAEVKDCLPTRYQFVMEEVQDA